MLCVHVSLVQDIYHLKGDGPVVFTFSEEVDIKVFKAIQVIHFPNLSRVAEWLSQGQITIQ